MIRLAWVSDDALITLRTALNVSHGWGPGFNASESVQGFTHPLWFIAITAIGAISNQWILGLLVFSVSLSITAVSLIFLSTTSIAVLTTAFLALLSSNAFMEYSTSGLENPLAYCSLGLILVLGYKSGPNSSIQFGRMALIGLVSAATLLTRADLLVLVAPAVAYIAIRTRSYRNGLALLLALGVPLVAWYVWSWFTYASLFPNTLAAKRNVDIPVGEQVNQGAFYLFFSVKWDIATAVIIVVGLALACLLGNAYLRLWALGISLYLVYVVWIGGDFMSGRFLAIPVYLAVAIGVLAYEHYLGQPRNVGVSPTSSGRRLAGVMLVAALVLATLAVIDRVPTSLAAPVSERWSYEDMTYSRGIADERGVWVGWAKRSVWDLTKTRGDKSVPTDLQEVDVTAPLGSISQQARNWPTSSANPYKPESVHAVGALIGTYGLALGPTAHIVDASGLTDRFIADIPFTASGGGWRVGHYSRPIPAGYLDAIALANPNKLHNPEDRRRLAQLWTRIHTGSGPVNGS